MTVSLIGCSRDVRSYPRNWRNFRTTSESVTNLYAQLQIETDLEQLLHTRMKSGRRVPGPIRYGHCHTHTLVLMSIQLATLQVPPDEIPARWNQISSQDG